MTREFPHLAEIQVKATNRLTLSEKITPIAQGIRTGLQEYIKVEGVNAITLAQAQNFDDIAPGIARD